MLKKLIIKNYALIDELEIVFSEGLNIITGETGAGKSIILGALGLILGERARTDIIRHNQKSAFVEGIFQIENTQLIQSFKNDFDLFDCELIVRREVHESGRSRAFVNDTPVTQQTLSSLGDCLVDIHGQHAHQSLLKVDQHIEFVDNYQKDDLLIDSVSKKYKELKRLHEELIEIAEKEKNGIEKRDLYEFQLSEIDAINPSEDEETQLIQEEKIRSNGERIIEISQKIKNNLYDGEDAVIDRIAGVERLLDGFANIDDSFSKWQSDCESARLTLDDIVQQIEEYAGKIDYDPQELESIRERILRIQGLKKKYGGTVESVLSYRDQIYQEIKQSHDYERTKNQINIQMDVLKKELSNFCLKLSHHRKKTAQSLIPLIENALNELGMPKSQFRIKFDIRLVQDGYIEIENQTLDVTEKGIDLIEFYISTNAGEPVKPLAQTASGGEISRIMLALKSVLADSDSIPLLVFDEIDTGISGRIADVVGKNLKALSRRHQIICITHLPQIASKADSHFSVEKQEVNGVTTTTVRCLDEANRLNAIAGLLGGEKVTETTLKTAEELLRQD